MKILELPATIIIYYVIVDWYLLAAVLILFNLQKERWYNNQHLQRTQNNGGNVLIAIAA